MEKDAEIQKLTYEHSEAVQSLAKLLHKEERRKEKKKSKTENEKQ